MSSLARVVAPSTAWRATAWYLALTIGLTWPLAPAIATHIPRDLGDSLLNCWILGWNADHALRALAGDFTALGRIWHGNIFYPEPYTLGYSEILVTQSIQILPVYALTRNLVLCYNLLFLSTFVLSGLGMFLLARALTGSWRVGFLAGLFFAFLPYRLYQASHLQVMSLQWMPFALFGLHRFAATGGARPLAGGALALVAQNLSCGYYLLFFSLVVPPFVLFELARYRRFGDAGTWIRLGAAALAVAALTVPFMQPYFALRNLHGTRRPLDEVRLYSADTWSWVTAEPETTVMSRWVRAMPKAEGALFPGVVLLISSGMGLAAGLRRAWRASAGTRNSAPRAAPGRQALVRRAGLWVAVLVGAWGVVTLGVLVVGWGGLYQPAGLRIRIQSLTRSLQLIAAGALLAVALSARARDLLRRAAESRLAFLMAIAVVTAYLSLGPDPLAAGDQLHGPPLYRWLYDRVPGFDGLRVPARMAAVASLFLVMAASWGVRDVIGRAGRRRNVATALIGALWLAETAMLPFPLAVTTAADTPALAAPPAGVPTGRDAPAVYGLVRSLPAAAVLLELPMGDISWELHYVYGSTFHWRRMVNGYSGYHPVTYIELANALRDPYRDPDLAWTRLLASGVTHVIVHGEAYHAGGIRPPDSWLQARGLHVMTATGTERLYRVAGSD